VNVAPSRSSTTVMSASPALRADRHGRYFTTWLFICQVKYENAAQLLWWAAD
jgi:hypothetical protein